MPTKDSAVLADLQKASRILAEIRLRIGKVGLAPVQAQEIGKEARAVVLQATSIAIAADLTEGVRHRWATGMLKRVRKALGYTYP